MCTCRIWVLFSRRGMDVVVRNGEKTKIRRGKRKREDGYVMGYQKEGEREKGRCVPAGFGCCLVEEEWM
ncbi:hypothetical protein SLEP1_g11094 [Rubroshorea leprosula]|uniref:Uncharacterized protein n=1 Tax=Rubroshorea leprosula TaxID=152421 RepID=A0AAV5IIP5_9ROSI|nr:hypothetical protein SLEP1_g11094 [Rubroshorea leprosula]